MDINEYAGQDATGLAELIRTGQVSADEVRDTATAAVTAVDGELNAVVDGPWTSATIAPDGIDGPFSGVPFVFKDILCHAAGRPTRMGTRALSDGVTFDHDTELMARFKRAGLVGVANTTTPELALSSATVSALSGVTLNPWDATVTAGGSSGGSSVLVATGAVPLAHANDGGGSIRIPAARNGLVGLKPSRGRISLGPDQQEVMSGNAVEFAVTRTVRDCAALLDAVHGSIPGDRYGAPPPARRYVDEIVAPGRRLRIGVCTADWSSVPVDDEVADEVNRVARTLSELGHTVDIVAPRIDWDAMVAAFNTIWCFGTAPTVVALAEQSGAVIDENSFEETTLLSYRHGLTLGPLELATAFAEMNAISRTMADFMGDWDILLTPTASRVHVPVTHLADGGVPATSEEWVRRVLAEYPLSALYNITGAPAISLPTGWSPDGLPIGMHFGAAVNGESELIALAAELEDALPWHHRRPPAHVTTRAAAATAAGR
ncbi:amidase [Gordonia jinghuaiqii]|uniref:amidase n=1 Tax=Gordonia jinghuaiqii TaxID=2758710 RepID=A0A7D7QGS8_9ACTN|nr:amidase family protein [Gordonia jinghuaiqii]MCR5979542.1 amidase [Gordonia jinghuaiqii]QMT00664.1 amidase [Gordonia jinghuaiqii]